MALVAQKQEIQKKFVEQPVIEAGMYPARISQVIDLGLQTQRPYQGQEKPPANEVMISYEFLDVFMVDEEGNELEDKPRWISESLPLRPINQEKATSTKRYFAADPKNDFGGDFSKLVTIPVNISVTNKEKGDKTYANISSTAAMRKRDADNAPELKNPPKVFDLDDPDMEIYLSLPEWVQEKICSNLNFQGSKLQALLGGKPAAPKKAEKQEVVEEVDEDELPW